MITKSYMEMGAELISLFGIDASKVRGFTIKFHINTGAYLIVEFSPEFNDETQEFKEIIKKFELVEK